jgi:hypothetical protein
MMSILDKLASALGRSDEVPNQILAREIANAGDDAAIRELVAALATAPKDVQHDAIKVLYEVGSLKPDLIAAYVDDFLTLLCSRDNRMVWGGMTALGTIADRQAAAIASQLDLVMDTTRRGSAITQDWGVRVLATLSAQREDDARRIFPFLLSFLKTCPPKDLPRHAESSLISMNASNRDEMLSLLETRKSGLKPAQAKRIDQLMRKIKAL